MTAAVAVLACGALAAAWAFSGSGPVQHPPIPAHVSIEDGGLRYEYDAVAGTETLMDLSATPAVSVHLVGKRVQDARRLRRMLEARLGVDSLERLHEEHLRDLESVRRLGYL